MAQTKPTSIFHQVQQLIADQLNSDEMLSAANVTFVAENSKDIDYEVQNALGRQGIVGLVMTPKADYIGITARGEVAYDLRDLTIQIVENVPVNRGLPNSTTALDAAQRAQEILASPNFTTFGVMNPVSIEQGEDSGLIVCQAKFNCNVHAKYIADPKTTKVKYTAASRLPDWEGDIVGELTDESIPNKEYAEVVEIGNHVTSIGVYAFSGIGALKNITIPNSVTSIESWAFGGCTGLTSVTIPGSVMNIGDSAFDSCIGLTSVTFSGKTIEQIQAMDNYPWGIEDTSIIIGDTQPLEWIPGGYRSTGDPTPGVLYTPEYIPVEKNHNITWKWGDSNIGASVQAYLLTYNDDKQILTYWTPNGATGQRTFNVGANASYIRYSVIDGFQDTTFVKDETAGRYLVKNGKIIF